MFKQPGANVIDTVDQIKVLLPRLIRNIPPGIEIEVVQDRTGTIRASVRDVEFTLALTVASSRLACINSKRWACPATSSRARLSR